MRLTFSLILTLLFAGAAGAQSAKEISSDFNKNFTTYTVKAGDVLNIVITPTDDLSKEVTVQSDGKITLKLIGEIQASGMTLKELSDRIEKEYGKYITKPAVSVTLKEFGKRKVYMMGQAKNSGSFDYRDGITVLELISLAGGFSLEAELTQVKVFRGSGEKRTVLDINMEEVINKGELRKDIQLKPDDIVYVPQKGVAGWNWFLNNIMPTVYLASTVVTIILLVR
ncbi:MAG: polysaccharide biosynthesis/export family protein [Candidatus Firestonebacteria bacterium]